MIRKLKEHKLLILIFVIWVGLLSCDSTDFVDVDDKTFHKQLLADMDTPVSSFMKLNE